MAFDSLETPSGKRERVLGGAATHFSLAASFFTKVRVVGVVGDDFLPEHEAVLTSKESIPPALSVRRGRASTGPAAM